MPSSVRRYSIYAKYMILVKWTHFKCDYQWSVTLHMNFHSLHSIPIGTIVSSRPRHLTIPCVTPYLFITMLMIMRWNKKNVKLVVKKDKKILEIFFFALLCESSMYKHKDLIYIERTIFYTIHTLLETIFLLVSSVQWAKILCSTELCVSPFSLSFPRFF